MHNKNLAGGLLHSNESRPAKDVRAFSWNPAEDSERQATYASCRRCRGGINCCVRLLETYNPCADPGLVRSFGRILSVCPGISVIWRRRARPAMMLTTSYPSKTTKTASKIRFSVKLFRPAASAKVGSWTFLTLLKKASVKLSSRGMVAVEGIINGFSSQST